jgi:hypothetical protein
MPSEFEDFFQRLRDRQREIELAEINKRVAEDEAEFKRHKQIQQLEQASIANLLTQLRDDERFAGAFTFLGPKQAQRHPGKPSLTVKHENMVVEFEVIADVDNVSASQTVVLSFKVRRWDLLKTKCGPYYLDVSLEDGISVTNLYEMLSKAAGEFIALYD